MTRRRSLAAVVLALALAGCTNGTATTTTTTTMTTTAAALPMPVAAPGGRIGASCADGWRSMATGQGACSHHGGVATWLYAEPATSMPEATTPEATMADTATMDETTVEVNGNPVDGFTWHDLAVGAGQSDEMPGAGADLDQIIAACDAFFDRLLVHSNVAEPYRARFDQVCSDTANYG
jgi:hypothetical protein